MSDKSAEIIMLFVILICYIFSCCLAFGPMHMDEEISYTLPIYAGSQFHPMELESMKISHYFFMSSYFTEFTSGNRTHLYEYNFKNETSSVTYYDMYTNGFRDYDIGEIYAVRIDYRGIPIEINETCNVTIDKHNQFSNVE